MTARTIARVNEALLVWARTTAGYSVEEAAKKLALPPERLRLIEHGDEKLSIAKLREVANVYKRPLAAFFLPEAPEAQELLHDFRCISNERARSLSPALRLELRQADDRRDDATELARELNRKLKAFTAKAHIDESPEEVGARVRSLIGITEKTQRTWRSTSKALRGWKRAIESLGVLVFETSNVSVSEMRGFSLAHRQFPVIVLNGKDAEAGRVFTMLHEFTHLLLNQNGLCDPFQEFTSAGDEARIEAFCNHVAGAALAPSSILKNLQVLGVAHPWTHEQLQLLARELSVSKEVVLRRLVILGSASVHHYRKMRKDFVAEYEALDAKRKGKKVIVPRERLIARNLGRSYIDLVFEAYGAEKISARSLSEHLGVKLNHIEKLEAEIFGKEFA